MGHRADKDLIFSHDQILKYIKQTRYNFQAKYLSYESLSERIEFVAKFLIFSISFFKKKFFFDIFLTFYTNLIKPLGLFYTRLTIIFQKILLSICQCQPRTQPENIFSSDHCTSGKLSDIFFTFFFQKFFFNFSQ